MVPTGLGMGAEAGGSEVETVGGVAEGNSLHPVQQRFLEHAALQCGSCSPGFIVATRALLEQNPDPSEEEARYYLAGNLCRCTGYTQIIEAVELVVAQAAGNAPVPPAWQVDRDAEDLPLAPVVEVSGATEVEG